MRNKLATYILASSVVLCSGGTAQAAPQLPPPCGAGQALTTDSNGQLVCQQLPAGALLPDCRKYSEALTSDGKSLSCVARNTELAGGTTALNNLEASEAMVTSYGTRLNMIPSVPQAAYCGSTASTTGRFSTGAAVGLAAASALCSQIAACGATARMCTVYDVYYSVASGVIKTTDMLAKSWVYMASWQNFSTSAVEPTAGLSDSCGGYTNAGTTNGWYGTAIRWENTAVGARALKVYTGPDRTGIGSPTGSYPGAPCNIALPIACCK